MSTQYDHRAVSRNLGMAAAAQGWALDLDFSPKTKAAATHLREWRR